MSVTLPYNDNLNHATKLSFRQAVVAFADDTTWIANSKEQMERIIQIAEDFFKLNDIQINGKKSNLIIVNPSKPREERKIRLSEEWVCKEEKEKLTRFLGIWLNNKLSEKQIKRKAKEVICSTARILNMKKMIILQKIIKMYMWHHGCHR